MALIIATGSNLADPIHNLQQAQVLLMKRFTLVAASRVYRSLAVDYENQPDFLNQVLQFRLPPLLPVEVMHILLALEKEMGRERNIRFGPRIIDLDIIFWSNEKIQSEHLVIPHPRWAERSFVVRPLQELPFFEEIKKWFTIPESFKIEAFPL
jgi:2-amino-4-hydroxy-6-hydroxymethyldihydropteridine diphosphokinase